MAYILEMNRYNINMKRFSLLSQVVFISILMFMASISFSQGTNEKNEVFIVGQITNKVNGAPIKGHEVLICADSIFNSSFHYNKKFVTDSCTRMYFYACKKS